MARMAVLRFHSATDMKRNAMPRLTIDDFEIEVPAGTKVIEAAERLGIMIPRFCYHKGLGSVGACRVCAVKFLQGPFKGVQMSCMIDAQDGMVVSTTDAEAVAFRKQVIEWLMLNHPHDCPACDEGGHCLLQDETVSGGHGIRRYEGRKRTYHDQYLGPFIAHEMNRCIHCYRCVRFYQEFAGYRDLGTLQIANRVYFGRFQDGRLESPFSGNLADICPTGVYTDRTARYKVRRWDLQRASSLCIHCSLGCNTVAGARYREVLRIEARLNDKVNGYFICDRGRFSYPYASRPDRPRRARAGGNETSMDEAIRAAAQKLSRIRQDAGEKSVACLGSVRSSLETLGALKRLSRIQGWRSASFFENRHVQRKAIDAVSSLDGRLAVSLREIEKSDFILAVGVDPINEAPMLALAMRQAYRKGAAVTVMDPRPISLPLEFEHLPVAPRDLDAGLHALVHGAEGQSSPRLERSRSPVIVCGSQVVRDTTPLKAAECANYIEGLKGQCGLFYVLPGANAFGAAFLSSPEQHAFADMIEEVEKGSIKALIVVESDPLRLFPDAARLKAAFQQLDLLLVIDYLPSQIAQYADVFLPSSTIFETGGSYINQEGRLQFGQAVHRVGMPIRQVSGGSHPPRIYGSEVPGGEPKAAWELLGELSGALAPEGAGFQEEHPWNSLAEENPVLGRLNAKDYPFDGVRVIPERAEGIARAVRPEQRFEPPSEEPLELFLVDWTFGTEELSLYAEVMQQVEAEPLLFMHADDAAKKGLADGDKVAIRLEDGSLEVLLGVRENMGRGVLFLPRHRRIEWQKIKNVSVKVPLEHIEKV